MIAELQQSMVMICAFGPPCRVANYLSACHGVGQKEGFERSHRMVIAKLSVPSPFCER